MSSFCANCGAATGGGRFCPKCGSPQSGAAPPSVSQMPYAPARKKSPVLKIVLISLAILFALAIVGAVKGYYFIKDRVEDAKQEYAKAKIGPTQRSEPGCDLLTKQKAAEILGTTIARVKGNEAGDLREYCNYYSEPASPSDAGTSDDDDNKGSAESKDDQTGLKGLESLAKKISKDAKDRPLLSAQIYRGNAAAALIGIKTVTRLAGNNEPSIPGPWDEAYFGPKDTTFVVRKGDNGFLLNLTHLEKKREIGLELAKVMVSGI